jgi:hypothetical protein
LDSTRE